MEHTYTLEEQKANRALWIAALRSGKYKQGRGALKTGNGSFCCLGVACDISGFGEWTFSDIFEELHYFDKAVTLPEEVRSWLGLYTYDGELTDAAYAKHRVSDLTTANDGGMSFLQIADMIEAGEVAIRTS